jgi:Lrp/AsnC family transcriptional regulator for asnA, asnC and gidA
MDFLLIYPVIKIDKERFAMLNDIDRKLIKALHQNGRATHVELSRQLGMHVSTIAKKMQLLEAEGIIKIRALPNPYKLGYSAHAVIAIETAHRETNAICSHLYRHFNVNLLITTFGRFDILSIVFFPTWEKLLSFFSGYLSSINGILSMETYFVKEIRKRHYGFPNTAKSPVQIDEIDLKLIEKLSENGRYTAQFLSEKVGISRPTCVKRLSFLLKEKIVEIKAIPNVSEMRYVANAFLMLRVHPPKLNEVCAKLSLNNDIYIIMHLFNGYDVFIGVNATSHKKLYKRIKKDIMSIDGIVSGETIIRAEILKRYYGGFRDNDEAGIKSRNPLKSAN